MAYSAALNTVYNQYLTTYAPKKSDTRYDTHKRSELKGITNSMVKVNKDAPLYKLESSPESREYIIGLKEESRILQNTIMSSIGSAEYGDINGKIAYSSDESIATARYVGDENSSLTMDTEVGEDGSVSYVQREVPEYSIEVQSLASAQVNKGKFLPMNSLGIEPGDYSFDMIVGGQGYEFQYTIREDDTNFDIQNRLSRLINNSGIHLNSVVEEDGEGNASLRIESAQVGIHYGESSRVFDIKDPTDRISGSGSVEYFGLDYVAREASNAHFIVNGIEASSASNTFILEKNYEITLNGVSPAEGVTTTVGVKPDTEAAVDNISNLIGGYNDFMRAINAYKDVQSKSLSLAGEMQGIAGLYSAGMDEMGITLGEDGTMEIDRDKLGSAMASEDSGKSVNVLKEFSNAVMRKSRQVSLNPVSYINKTVVEYKNPGKTFSNPYTASAYAGLMFNSYC
jgi:flagellar hook-associated protein 2